MPKRQVIDVHCHLFNAKYAVTELAAATWNHLWGNYPHPKSTLKKKQARGIAETLEGVKDFAAWIARLLNVVISDCEGNFQTSQKNFAASGLGENASLAIAPLMMDIYFSLSDNGDEETASRKGRRAAPVVKTFVIAEEMKKDFDDHFESIKNLILSELEKTPKTTRRSAADQTLIAVFDDARKDLLAQPKKARRGFDPYAGIELSPGYRRHMDDLEALAKKYPGQVFPFLAVDPRRIGILDLVKMKVQEGRGIFRGVKIYPPLGYLPTHPNLIPVFDYCEKFDIPITFHCSPGGMNNFRGRNYASSWAGENRWEDFQASDGKKSPFYTAPEKWLPVLTRWKKLRINFAHMGGGDQLDENKKEWMNQIIEMIRTHDNVYTDISYHARNTLPDLILKIVKDNPCLEDKLMFGTDYIMIMMDPGLGGLSRYFDHYDKFPDQLLYDNAKRFLKL